MCGIKVLDVSMYRQSEGAGYAAKHDKIRREEIAVQEDLDKIENIREVDIRKKETINSRDLSRKTTQSENVRDTQQETKPTQGWEFIKDSGYYYDRQSEYFFDPKTKLYYHNAIGKWISDPKVRG